MKKGKDVLKKLQNEPQQAYFKKRLR